MSHSIHQFEAKNTKGETVSMNDYKGKVLLLVNTASKCGFTPQLEDMTDLYEEFKNEDFEILAFPSNDFAGQEPLKGEAIEQFCVLKYQAEYPIFEKSKVKGNGANDIFKFLGDKKQNGVTSAKPRWNFYKFLIDKEGKLVDYYSSLTKPTSSKIKKNIQKLLKK